MKLALIPAAALALLAPVTAATPVLAADEVQVSYTNCPLNARQASAGWTCTAEVDQSFVSREIGNPSRPQSHHCQDAYSSIITYRSYNPAGNLAPDKTIVVGDGELSDWGPSYSYGFGCNYDVID